MRFTKRSSLYVPDAGRVTVRERRPPKLAVRATMSGRVAWSLRRAGKEIAAGEQPNLLTDFALDEFGSYGTSFRAYGAIGTGSSEPDVSDTGLDAEVQSKSGTASGSDSYTLDLTAGVETWESSYQYVFVIAAANNLTEFGMRRTSSNTANLCVRELFRDELGDPVVISVLPNDELTVVHTFVYTYGPLGTNLPYSLNIAEVDRNGNPVTTHTVSGWASVVGNNATYRKNAMLPNYGNGSGYTSGWTALTKTTYTACTPTGTLGRYNGGDDDFWAYGSQAILQAYVGGSYKRQKRFDFTESEGNTVWTGIELRPQDDFPYSKYGGVQMIFDQGGANPTFEKENTHIFQIDLEVSWARPGS